VQVAEDAVPCYDDLAEYYHLIFEDWDRSIKRQAGVIRSLLEARLGPAPLRVFDCTCGIGTQTIGLARLGHTVVASDVSKAAVARAEREVRCRGLTVRFHVSDVRDLPSVPESEFDAVLAIDNSLPHLLSDIELVKALRSIHAKLRAEGVFIASIRDYDSLLQSRPVIQGPAFYMDEGRRRIVHQVWDWQGNEYVMHMYLTWQDGSSWETKHFAATYRALKRSELTRCLEAAEFSRIEWLMPEATGFYQPMVIAKIVILPLSPHA
jgi:glycine/sarcosine N-methyltransferase